MIDPSKGEDVVMDASRLGGLGKYQEAIDLLQKEMKTMGQDALFAAWDVVLRCAKELRNFKLADEAVAEMSKTHPEFHVIKEYSEWANKNRP